MRFLIFILTLFITTSIVPQKRSLIIKEVNAYKNKIYKTHAYHEDIEVLNELIFTYFHDKKYRFEHTKEAPHLSFHKTITLSCSSPRKQDYYGAPFYECKRDFYVFVWFSSSFDKSKTIHLSTEIVNNRTFNPHLNEQVLGTYKINAKAFYKFLYTALNKEHIMLPEEILLKINNYNAKHKQEEKKIVEGRDY